jgi:hypothetical protein
MAMGVRDVCLVTSLPHKNGTFRILKVNELQTITQEVGEAARACLVIGTA